MRAEIKRIHSPDVVNLKSFNPEHPDCFALLLQVMAGPEGEEGEESFDIVVCTLGWIQNILRKEGPLFPLYYLIVEEYDYGQIVQTVRGYIERCEGKDWREVAGKIARIGRWEFEDYVPCQNEDSLS
jgi:hypothetical protein